MTARIGVCLAFSLYCNWTDWRETRVHNRAAAVFALLGPAWWGFTDGWRGMAGSLAGGAVMLALIPLFALRMLGAGDVKALMAVGLLLGFPEAGRALLYSLLGAGVAAACALAVRRNARARLRKLWDYMKCCWLLRKPLAYTQTLGEGGGGFHFTFGVTLGLLALLLETVWKG